MTTCAQCRAANQAAASHCWNCGLTLPGIDASTYPDTGAHTASVRPDPMIGRSILDQYVVRSKLGEGGMGALYVAEQPSIGRNAVIKIVHPWLSRDPAVMQRFAVEARAAARLQNPHIVSIYNYGKMPDGTLFLAMEHITGCTLADLLRAEGRLEPARAVAIVTQVCEALAEAHRRGVVHRDLKPTNIMLVQRGGGPDFVKVLDFGIAKLDGTEVSSGGKIVGTPRYMSPEQLRGDAVDGRSDLYTLGVILYEMLTGRPPFSASDPAGLMHAHLSEQPPPLMTACPGLAVPPAVEACLMRALAKEAHLRPQSADQLADELWSALMATVIGYGFVPLPPPRPRPSRLAVGAAVTVTAVSLLAAGIGGFLYWRDEPNPDPAQVRTPESEPEVETPPTAPLPPWLGFGAPSPEKQALMQWSVDELETELERVTLLSAVSRASIELSMAEYREAVTRPPQGVDPERYQKALLAELIARWRKVSVRNPPPDRSLTELEAVFLTMKCRYDTLTRRRMLDDLKNDVADGPDPEGAIKARLFEWMTLYGGEDVEPELEILDEGSDNQE